MSYTFIKTMPIHYASTNEHRIFPAIEYSHGNWKIVGYLWDEQTVCLVVTGRKSVKKDEANTWHHSLDIDKEYSANEMGYRYYPAHVKETILHIFNLKCREQFSYEIN